MVCGHHLLNGSLFRVCLDSLFSAPVVTSICTKADEMHSPWFLLPSWTDDIPEASLTLCHAAMIECSLNHF